MVIAWYRFDREKTEWTGHAIYQCEPAEDAPDDISKRDAHKDFALGTADTDLEMAEIDGGGDLDLVRPGKSGLYLFENPGNK